jgi:hypothetical protein
MLILHMCYMFSYSQALTLNRIIYLGGFRLIVKLKTSKQTLMHKKIYYNKYNNQRKPVNAPNLKYKKSNQLSLV